MPEIVADGCRLSYSVNGWERKPALLLSNALGATRALWDSQLPAFAQHFRLIRYDTRGHGTSSAPAGEYTIDQLGRDVLAILDDAGIARAHVCGLSLGGLIAIWLAHHAPTRVSKIVLANTAARIGSAAMWQERVDLVKTRGLEAIAETAPPRWFTEAFCRQHPSVVADCRRMLLGCSPNGYAACAAALRDADLRASLGGIAAPTLVMAGAFDPVTPPADAAALCAGIAGARGVELAAAHFSNIERAASFNDAVVEFLHG